MSKCIIWETSDGGVWVTYPNNNPSHGLSMSQLPNEMEDVYLDRVANHFLKYMSECEEKAALLRSQGHDEPDPPKLIRRPNMEVSHPMLQDRTYRDAWKWNNGITVDLTKAKDIHYRRLIAKRDLKIRVVRNISLRNRLKGLDEAVAIAVENAQTVEQLKAVTHPDLE